MYLGKNITNEYLLSHQVLNAVSDSVSSKKNTEKDVLLLVKCFIEIVV